MSLDPSRSDSTYFLVQTKRPDQAWSSSESNPASPPGSHEGVSPEAPDAHDTMKRRPHNYKNLIFCVPKMHL